LDGGVNGIKYNMTLGAHKYLIQQNWLNVGDGGCVLSYSTPSGFAMTLGPSGQSIVSGSQAASQLTLSLAGGFGDPIMLSADGAPDGVTVSFNPNPATSSSTISVTTSPSTPPGWYPITVSGGSGDLVQTTQFGLQVGAPNGYSLAVSPAFASVTAGHPARYDISVNRQAGFSDPVTLSLDGLPAGVTAHFSQTTVQDHSTLIVESPPMLLSTFTFAINGLSGDVSSTTFATLRVAPHDGPGRHGGHDDVVLAPGPVQ
jgi:hypothetical protein